MNLLELLSALLPALNGLDNDWQSIDVLSWIKENLNEENTLITDWKAKYEELYKKHCLLLELICEADLEE